MYRLHNRFVLIPHLSNGLQFLFICIFSTLQRFDDIAQIFFVVKSYKGPGKAFSPCSSRTTASKKYNTVLRYSFS